MGTWRDWSLKEVSKFPLIFYKLRRKSGLWLQIFSILHPSRRQIPISTSYVSIWIGFFQLTKKTRWWQLKYFLFSSRSLGVHDPIWLIFFKWVGSTTTKKMSSEKWVLCQWGGYLAELEASLFSEGLHTLGEKPSGSEMKGRKKTNKPCGMVAKQVLLGSKDEHRDFWSHISFIYIYIYLYIYIYIIILCLIKCMYISYVFGTRMNQRRGKVYLQRRRNL